MTGLPPRMTSVVTATTDVVISEKSKTALLIFELMGTAISRIAVILMPVASFRFDSCRLDDLAPALDLEFDLRRELLGRARDHVEAEIGHALPDVRHAEHAPHF